MVLRPALMAMARQLAAWHCDEGTIRAVDDFKIADDECIVKRDRAKSLQPVVGVFHQLDPNLGYFHRFPPSGAPTSGGTTPRRKGCDKHGGMRRDRPFLRR